jgi:hypothetical protein
MRHHAETSATMIADLGMPNHTFVHGSELPVCTSSGALCMSSAAAHWSPAVTELVQLVRTRWRENCFVGTKKRFQLCFETRGPRQMCGTCCFAPNICSSLPWWLGFIPGLPRIGNSAGFFILSQLPAWAKKAPRTYRKRGAGPLSDRKSRSIIIYRKIEEVRPSS